MPSNAERDAYNTMQARLLETTIRLNETYSQAAFEFRTGHLGCKLLRDYERSETLNRLFFHSEIYSAFDQYYRASPSRTGMGNAAEAASRVTSSS